MSLARAFFVANLLLLEYDKATQEQYDFKQYVNTLLENEDVLNNSLKKLADTIKQTNKYGSITT
jgi:flagellar biosynthesis regulator FlbT